MEMKNRKAFCLVLCFFFFTPSFFYSQAIKDAIYSASPETGSQQTRQELAPLFILQGAVKLKGRPESGVALTLTKDGKPVSKIITPKNGLYYFQLQRSGVDEQSEYLLTITKSKVASGKLKVNTFTPNERLTTLPYIFNLDINIAPLTSTGTVERRDFGRIKWIAEKNSFNFDKEYVPMNEKEIIADSLKQVAIAKENAELKRQADSIAKVMAADIEAEEAKEKLAKAKAAKAIMEKAAAAKEAANKEFVKQTKSKITTGSKSKETVTGTEPGKNTKIKTTKDQSSSEAFKTMASENKEKIRSQQKQNSSDDLITNNSTEKGNRKMNESATKNKINVANENLADASQSKLIQQKGLLKADSMSSSGDSPKDLFFLTGVPMERFKKNLSASGMNNKNADVYNANEVFSENSERSRLLAAKLRYERKKAENFAKKQETNNTLTSLLDVVEEFDKNKRNERNFKTVQK